MLREGENVGPYRVIEQLGSGGMATVYKAYHSKLDRHVAIKMMHQAFLEDKTFHTRFEREAQIVARLEHPHIVPIYDFSEHERQPYLVIKYIDGRTLKAVLIQDGALPVEEIVRIMRPIADALTYAHQNGVLHRDIKPSNILIDTTGTPYLTDFGLARIAQAGESTISHDMLLGTPHYISPEQAKGDLQLTASTDIYSLGVILYELVVGRVPFSADTPYAIVHDHIYTPLPMPRKINPDIPPAVEAVLVKALAKTPADRYTSASAMMDDFSKALEAGAPLHLEPDRAETAAISIAKLRQENPPQYESDLQILSPLPPEPPDPAENPVGFARWQVQHNFGDAVSRIEQAVGEERAQKVSSMINRLEHNIQKKIREGKIKIDKEKGFAAFNPFSRSRNEPINYMSEDAIRRRVKKRFEKRNEFIGHMTAYVFVMILLGFIWRFTSGFIDGAVGEVPWPLFVLFGWGAGFLAHGIDTYYQTGKRAEKREQRLDEGMTALYGYDWANTVTEGEFRKARKRILESQDKRISFYQHLSVYASINTLLWIIWGSSAAFITGIAAEFPWPIIVMLGWGIGLFVHGVDTYISSGSRQKAQEEAIQREIERQRDRAFSEKAKRKNDDMLDADPVLRLNDEGEFTDSFVQEWTEDEKRKRGN